MYCAEDYDIFEALKANVTELHSGDCDYLEDAELIFQIFKDIEALKTRVRDLEEESRSMRYRAIKAEFELKKLNASIEKKESE